MAEDINSVTLVGRTTRDAELVYTSSGYPVLKFSLAVNRRRKSGEEWIDEGNFFDVNLWGKRGESLHRYLTKGVQVGVIGQLRQERWEQDGAKRSKVSIEAINIQLLTSRSEREGSGYGGVPSREPVPQQPRDVPAARPSEESYNDSPPAANDIRTFEDDIPF